MSVKKNIKEFYLILRSALFKVCFIFTSKLRKKELKLEKIESIIIFGLNRLGDNVLSIPALETLRNNFPKAKIVIISNRYVKDILESDGSVDEILFYRKENIYGKIKTLFMFLRTKWNLGIDLTCDYTFLPVFLLFISGARFRIGYNIKERGFLFNRSIEWSSQNKHFVERLFDILKEIELKILNKKATLKVPESSKKFVDEFLKTRGILKDELLIGIHPGGYYRSQRWSVERFAEVADSVIRRYNAKIFIIADKKEKQLLDLMGSLMKENAIKVYNFSLLQLIGLIKEFSLLICNNSGILHLATALDVPTVSTMGPTDPSMWWPQGENNIVLKKDLSCLGCKIAFCSSHECMDLISVDEMLEAIDKQIKRVLK